MVRICIFYPNNKSARFDVRYYVEKHMPMSIALLSGQAGFRGVSVEHGLGGALPGTDAAFVAMCHFLFESLADFVAAFAPHADTLRSDMHNYTDIEPIIQVSEVLISQQSQTEMSVQARGLCFGGYAPAGK